MKTVQIIKAKLNDFRFFYSYIGKKIFLALMLSFSVGLMDGLGLAMFIPLLQMVDGKHNVESSPEEFGNLDPFITMLESIGLSLNLTTVLGLILFFFSLKGIFRFLESYYSVVLTTNFAKTIRLEAVDSITNLGYKHFINLDSGKIQNTLSVEIERVRLAYISYSNAIQTFMAVVVYITLAFLVNAQFALLVIIGGLLSNFIYTKIYKKTKQTSRQITLSNHEFHGLMIQQVQNFKYLRATGQIGTYSKHVKKAVLKLAFAFKKIGFFNSLLVATKEPLSIAVVVLVILVQVNFFSTELGPIILSLLFFYRSLNQVIVFQNHWNNFMNYSGALENYQNFIADLKKHKLNYSIGIEVPGIQQIELREVSFSYNQAAFLKNINITITKNQTIAFVGTSGSGKTTLSNIIAGLFQCDGGQVLINNIDIQKIKLDKYQSSIGYITQDPVIFDDTLFNNVSFWDEKNETTLKKFYKCIEQASLLDFVSNAPDPAEIPLGNNGIMVSGGQKQRIAIARELYKRVELLIMDEATSALDSGTEKEIQKYFEQLKGRFTIIVIAHRLSTIANADTIFLLKDGKIEDYGDFTSLQNRSAEFRKMVELQGLEVKRTSLTE